MPEFYQHDPPFDEGMLDVGDGNRIHWTVSGTRDGTPAVFVHGGPGSGSTLSVRQYFDPARYMVVTFDQRGCGESTPPASDPTTDMSVNTTDHLLDDMERLRRHLGVDTWLVFGGSWGSTLGLTYAEAFPERVSELVLSPVTTTSQSELDWLYGGLSRFFPEAWHRFSEAARADGVATDAASIVADYARRMEHPDPDVRDRAVDEWCAWEDEVLAHEADDGVQLYSDNSREWKHSFVRIAAHYFSNGAWLDENQLLRNADRLAGIPGVLVHGRLDFGSPLETAWKLDRAWPDAELVVVDESGHTGDETMGSHLRDAFDSFAER
jgi:proline iminopeptidase